MCRLPEAEASTAREARGSASRALPALLRACFVLAVLAAMATPALAQYQVPQGFDDTQMMSGFQNPVGLAFVPDGRLFVIEQKRAWIRLLLTNRMATPDPVAVVDSVRFGYGELGLLGVAVDPRWPVRPYLYVIYNFSGTRNMRLARYTLGGDLSNTGNGSLTIDPASRYLVMTNLPDTSEMHNGGTLRFGRDSMLYVSLGDDHTPSEAQDLTSLRGKLLRLDVRGLPDGGGGPPGDSLLTPGDNPYAQDPNPVKRLVWASGLRNPFRFHIDPGAASTELFVSDVGEDQEEEADDLVAPGRNLEWPIDEGFISNGWNGVVSDTSTFTPPIYAYPHEAPNQPIAIISAGVYRRPSPQGGGFPAGYDGNYFIADFYLGWIRRLKRSGNSWAIAPPVSGQPDSVNWAIGHGFASDFAVGPGGTLWYAQQANFSEGNAGSIRRIRWLATAGVDEHDRGIVSFAPPAPSPARGSVSLAYTLARPARAALDVYDLGGRRVRQLEPETQRGAGEHRLAWDGLDDAGHAVPAGLYFAQLRIEGMRYHRRVALLR